MWTKKNKSADPRREYDREIFKSSVVSLFWNLIAFRKKEAGVTFSALAEKLGINKSAPSRWFSGDKPNWEANTMSDIANALGVELEIYARDVKTGRDLHRPALSVSRNQLAQVLRSAAKSIAAPSDIKRPCRKPRPTQANPMFKYLRPPNGV